MHAAFAIKSNMEYFASMSTGLVELVVLIVKPVYDVANSLLLPRRFKNLVIATGASLKVLVIDLPVFERYTIENAGFGNVMSSFLQLLVDLGQSNRLIWSIGDPLAVPPHCQEPAVGLPLTMGAGSCLAGQVVVRVIFLVPRRP